MPTIVENGQSIQITIEEFNRRVAQNRALFPTDEIGRPLGDNSTIIIDGVEYDMGWFFIDNEPFGGASQLLSVNTRSYVEEPTRSNDGSMPNIDDHDTFVVPRATFNFKYWNIRDYQRFTNRISMKNSFNLKYFDKDFGLWVEHNMYVEPQEAVRLYNIERSAIGVIDYEVAFVGTLNNLQTFKVEFAYDFDEQGNAVENNSQIIGWANEYFSSTTYTKGNIVEWTDGKRYKAIFEDSIVPTEIEISNTTYWQAKTPSYWLKANTYNQGAFVYNSENGKTTYYEAISNVLANVEITNSNYWKRVSPLKHDNKKKYEKGVYVYSGDTLTNENIYQAIYYNTSFSDKAPSETNYWVEVQIGKAQQIEWGRTIQVPPPSEVYTAPSGKTASVWVNAQGYVYRPNVAINIYVDTILVPKWE